MKAFSFEGKGFEYFKIWVVNILLTIITLGLYYPWAKVRNKRYIYGNSTLEGRNFDYHATGKQIFLSYLIAMALLLVYVIIQNVSPTGSLVIFVVFIGALPWIIWRSLMFNMRVTSFSNVRFSFNGALGGAYINYMLLPILFFLSLYGLPIAAAIIIPMFADSIGVLGGFIIAVIFIAGIALALYMYALLKNKNTSYVINSSSYGQGQFAAKLNTIEFLKIQLKTLGLFLAGMLAYMIAVAVVATLAGLSESMLSLAGSLDDPEAMGNAMDAGLIGFAVGFVYIGLIAISILVFSYSYSRQRAYILSNTMLDSKIDLASTLRARPLAFVSLTNFLAIVFSLGLAIPWATVRMTRFVLEHTQIDTSLGFDEYLTQQQQEQSALGDQLGDAFDVDVGIGF
jgi:uncharacterized membrane protein YjgN (DUF898 family)